MSTVEITLQDAQTFRIESPDGHLVWGGLGPDFLALGRVTMGPVIERGPGVFTMPCSSEAAVCVGDVPFESDVAPYDAVYEAPITCLVDDRTAAEQLGTLLVGVTDCLRYAATHRGLDERLQKAALGDRGAGRGSRVRDLVERHVMPLPAEWCSVLPSGEPARVPTDRLADAVERITGERPRNDVQVRAAMRRWARSWRPVVR